VAGAEDVFQRHRGGMLAPEAGDLAVRTSFALAEIPEWQELEFSAKRKQERIAAKERQVCVHVCGAASGLCVTGGGGMWERNRWGV
jgi:hypothetical protein